MNFMNYERGGYPFINFWYDYTRWYIQLFLHLHVWF